MLKITVGEGKVGRYLAIGGVLTVLGILVGGILFWFRNDLHGRMINREVAVMEKQVSNNVRQSEENYLLDGELFLEDDLDLLSNPARVPSYIVDGLLGMLSLDGIKGLFIYDREGFLQESLSPKAGIEVIPDQLVQELEQSISNGRLSDTELELMIPLFLDESEMRNFLGTVVLVTDGSELLKEFRILDSKLFNLCWIILLLGGGVIATVLHITFGRMEVAQRLLEERGRRLAAANEKLLLASKTSAVGSLTANLVHGLKNPLGSIKEFVNLLKETNGKADQEDIELAGDSVHRMQDLIQDTLSVMESSGGQASFSVSLSELKEEILRKLTPIAKSREVKLYISEITKDLEVDSVRGNLMILILCNLGQNAIEATSNGKQVSLNFTLSDCVLHCHVGDEGEGLPEWMKTNPFQTIRSQKKGGSGIGLALSQQLAQQLDADLALESTSEQGTVFKFSLRVA